MVVCILPHTGARAADSIGEMIVSGSRPGPRLWQVHQGASNLWILGTVSPLLDGVSWRSAEVVRLLGRTDTVLAAKPLQISLPRALWIMLAQRGLVLNPGGRQLRELLPPALYGRFAALRSRYGKSDDQWERYRPLIAGALLEDEALKANGLSTRLDVSLTVRRLAREHHVPITEVNIPGASDLLKALKTVSPGAESGCFQTILETVESGIPALRERANAWSSGDVERIRATPESAEANCERLLSTESQPVQPLAQIRSRWLEALERALSHPGAAIAVVDMDLLLSANGLLQRLRADGYAVDGP